MRKHIRKNPRDGHTLQSTLQQAAKAIGFGVEMAICGFDYRTRISPGECKVQIVNRFRKRVSPSLLRWGNKVVSHQTGNLILQKETWVRLSPKTGQLDLV